MKAKEAIAAIKRFFKAQERVIYAAPAPRPKSGFEVISCEGNKVDIYQALNDWQVAHPDLVITNTDSRNGRNGLVTIIILYEEI